MRFLGLILSSLLIKGSLEDVAQLANCHSSSISNEDLSDFQKARYESKDMVFETISIVY